MPDGTATGWLLLDVQLGRVWVVAQPFGRKGAGFDADRLPRLDWDINNFFFTYILIKLYRTEHRHSSSLVNNELCTISKDVLFS